MPSIPSATYDSGRCGNVIIIQGDASEKTVAFIKAAMAQQNAELPTRVVAAVRDAKTRGCCGEGKLYT